MIIQSILAIVLTWQYDIVGTPGSDPQSSAVRPVPQCRTPDNSISSTLQSAPDPADYRSSPSLPTSSGQGVLNTTPQDSQHERRGGGSLPGTHVAKKDYWRLAVDQLQQEDQSVAEQIAAVQQAAHENGGVDFIAQLLDATNQAQQDLEHRRSKITIGSREYLLRD